MIHRASRLRRVEDVVLVVVPCALLLTHASSKWLWLLALAGMFVFIWSVLTLHFPREVDLDEDGVRFRAYGREHSYAWKNCRVRVRKFLVKDRVLVRMEDAASGRSRSYWLVAHLSEFPALVASVQSRANGV